MLTDTTKSMFHNRCVMLVLYRHIFSLASLFIFPDMVIQVGIISLFNLFFALSSKLNCPGFWP